ncbi:MAG: aminotransferase class I/II-fold pyridoxal phosphate-dependent enzyme [Candidatus Abyssobacteria bacterium SURF_17]|uniref:Aminotransferase n=1 Tax=Candidatus Abyssobacteria bacterium SURF_17 TaxID=2093361 RepID=A0A419F0Y0_9BACT|nr:MAG: aminotransferase class I/II-fold pyridoxal phosphate-dependent enzyme [Candidatus Abyssubacteria bacterium SURF_17]
MRYISKHMERIPPYMFARINQMKLHARREGKDVIDLGMGNPDRPTPPHVVEKLCEVVRDPKSHRYSASSGIPHLRRAIADWYQRRFGVDLDPENEVVSVIGSKEGICHLFLAILDEGDLVLVPSPTYPIHYYSVVIAGGHLHTVPLTAEGNFLPDLSKVAHEVYPRPKVLILSYPNNPTTQVVDLAFFEEVAEFAKREQILIVHDLAYSEICFDGYRAPSFLQAKGAKEVGVEFYSLSKTYNMAGWRVGFAVGNRHVIAALAKLKSYYDYGIFTPIQVAAIDAIRGDQSCVDELNQIYSRRRDVLVRGLNSLGWNVPLPKATMYVWAPIPEKYRSLGSMKFAELLLEKALVATSPGVGFGTAGEGYLRFALVENERRIKQALRGIRTVMGANAVSKIGASASTRRKG